MVVFGKAVEAGDVAVSLALSVGVFEHSDWLAVFKMEGKRAGFSRGNRLFCAMEQGNSGQKDGGEGGFFHAWAGRGGREKPNRCGLALPAPVATR